MDLIAAHYKEIKTLYKSRLYNTDKLFDEDSFNDAFIKCVQRFNNDIIDYECAIKYFWIAYINTVKANTAKSCIDIKDHFDAELHDCIDNEDPSQAEYIYNIVMDAITTVYGENDMLIYSLYKYHDWTQSELINAGYDCTDFDTKIKTIHKFVKTYCKNKRKIK